MLAGVTLASLAIPEVMGYTAIAGMPVITGLYTILLPVLVFAVLGSSRHLVVGADSATAAVLAAGLAGVAATGSERYVALAGLVALMAAAFLLVARVVGLGFLADFLSRTVLVGFLTGVGVQIACGQVAGMLGIPKGAGVTVAGIELSNTLGVLVSTLQHAGDLSWSTAAVSAAVIAVILGGKRITTRVPAALIAVIGAVLVSWRLDLADHGVAVLGPVPGGLPTLGLPAVAWSDAPALMGTAASIFVLILAQSAATSRAYAARYGDRFDEDTDLVGLSAANLAAGLSGTFVVNGSPTKTQMVDSAGGRSQVAHLTTGALVAVVLVFLTKPLQFLPVAVLASVVFLIGVQLIDLPGLRHVWAQRRDELIVAVLTAAVVVAVGVEQGIVVAMAASLVDHLRRSYRPPTAVLRRDPAAPGRGWHSVPVTPAARSLPGFVVYRFAAPLYYANAEHFAGQVLAFADGGPLDWLCLDFAAVPDVDLTGAATLRSVHTELAARGVRLVLAETMHQVRRSLAEEGLAELVAAGSLFRSVDEAATAFEHRTTRGPD